MTNKERLRKIVSKYALVKEREKEAGSRRAIENRVFNSEYGDIAKIRENVRLFLEREGVQDDQTNSIIGFARSNPGHFHSIETLGGLSFDESTQLAEANHDYLILTQVQFKDSKIGRLRRRLRLLKGADVHIQIGVKQTGQRKSLSIPPLSEIKGQKERDEWIKRKPLLDVIKGITSWTWMDPITDSDEFPLEIFDNDDTETFLLPKLS